MSAIISRETSDRLDAAIQSLKQMHYDLYADERDPSVKLSELSAEIDEVNARLGRVLFECQIAIGQYAVAELERGGVAINKQSDPDDIPF